MAETPAKIYDVGHLEDVHEDVDLAPVVAVVEVQTAVAVHEVEAVIRLIAERREELQHALAVLLGDGVVEVAVLALERWLVRAGRVQVDARSTQELGVDALLLRGGRDTLRFGDGILERPFRHRYSATPRRSR